MDEQLQGSTVTIVLIGRDTARCPYVLHEIQKSWLRGNALLGIQVHDLRDQYDRTNLLSGDNPFDAFTVNVNDGDIRISSGIDIVNRRLSDLVSIHAWTRDQGKIHMGAWIEEAADAVAASSLGQRPLGT